jgi:uncharacterized membrane protein YecN with MAPEG domain
MISSLYASILALVFLFLTIRTVKLRRKFQVAIGDGENQILKRAIRAQGNFCETVPLALILLTLAEINGINPKIIHFCAIILLIGRLSHAFGISQENEKFKFRISGMVMTISSILILALTNIFVFFLMVFLR